MYKLIVSDLDGTLLNKNGEIDKDTVSAIKKLEQKNVKFAMISGRGREYIEKISKKYDLNCIIGALNGAQIILDNKNLIGGGLGKKSVQELIEFCETENLIYQLYKEKKIITKNIEGLFEELINFGKLHCDDVIGVLDGAMQYYNVIYKETKIKNSLNDEVSDDILKIVILSSDAKRLSNIQKKFSRNKELSIVSSHISNIEITKKNINKGYALSEICKLLNISNEEVIAVGDNFNDIPMFEKAGKSVAVENSPAEIKTIVDLVVANNNENPIVDVINKFII